MTLLTLVGALLVKFRSGFQSTGAVQEGYSDDMVQAGLIGTAALVGIFGLCIVASEVGAKAARALFERVACEQVPSPVRDAAAWVSDAVAWVRATTCCRKCRGEMPSPHGHAVGGGDALKVTQWAGAGPPVDTQTTVTPLHRARGSSAGVAAREARNPAVPLHDDTVVAGATNTTAAV